MQQSLNKFSNKLTINSFIVKNYQMQDLVDHISQFPHQHNIDTKQFIPYLRDQLTLILLTLKQEQQAIKNHYQQNMDSLKVTILQQQSHIQSLSKPHITNQESVCIQTDQPNQQPPLITDRTAINKTKSLKVLLRNRRHSICDNSEHKLRKLGAQGMEEVSNQNHQVHNISNNRLSLQICSDTKRQRVSSSSIKNRIMNSKSKGYECERSKFKEENTKELKMKKYRKLLCQNNYPNLGNDPKSPKNWQEFSTQKIQKYQILSPSHICNRSEDHSHTKVLHSANNKENQYFKPASSVTSILKQNNDIPYKSLMKLDENCSIYQQHPKIQEFSNKKCINVRVPVKMIDVSGDIKPR